MEKETLAVQVCPCHVDIEKESGGVANIVRQICLRLADMEARVLLLCGNRELGTQTAEPGVRCYGPYIKVRVIQQRSHPLMGPTREIRRAIMALPSDSVVHVHTCFSAFTESAMHVASRRDIPFVFTPHGKLSHDALKTSGTLKGIWWRFLTRRLVNNASIVCVSSTPERLFLPQLGVRSASRIIPNGYESGDQRSTQDSTLSGPILPENFVLFLGYLDPRKQPEFLVKVFARSRLRQSHFLVFAGPDKYGYRPRIESEIATAGLEARVIFTGPVYGSAKWRLLKAAKCLCLPSLSEGLPVVLSEALGAGTPSIYSSGCNFPEIAASGAGIELQGFDVDAWCRALEAIVLSPERQLSMRAAAEIIAPRYTWRAIVGQWMSIYNGLKPINKPREAYQVRT